MCQYLSGGIFKKGPFRVVVGETPKSHTNIAKLNGVRQNDIAEFEWTSDDVSSLEVRSIDEEEKERLTKEILSHFKTRKELEKYIWRLFWGRTKKFNEGLDLGLTPISELPEGLKVSGCLDLSYTEIKKLPKKIKVGGHINLRKTPISELPEGLKVSGCLDLSYTKIKSLPKDIKIKGSLDLEGSLITELPEGLKVGQGLILKDTPITKLPERMEIKGYLDLRNTKIKKIPDKFKDKIIR